MEKLLFYSSLLLLPTARYLFYTTCAYRKISTQIAAAEITYTHFMQRATTLHFIIISTFRGKFILHWSHLELHFMQFAQSNFVETTQLYFSIRVKHKTVSYLTYSSSLEIFQWRLSNAFWRKKKLVECWNQ